MTKMTSLVVHNPFLLQTSMPMFPL